MEDLILAINPGSTSTKIALYQDKQEIFNENITHSQQELEQYERIIDQIPMRLAVVRDVLSKHGYSPEKLSIVMGRGGLLPPVHTGGYQVNQTMLNLIMNEQIPPHASNLGAVLAAEIAKKGGIKAYIYDAVSANEFPPVAKITGMPEVERKSFYHVLNSRATAMRYAENRGLRYDELNLIVAHLGGGITVGVHKQGKIVDTLSDDNGPFAPERAGSVPLLDVIEMCYSGKYSKAEMIKKVRGQGGLRALIGTSDARVIDRMVQGGDRQAALVVEAQSLQIAKGIGLLAPVLGSSCDAIILTGGLAYFEFLVKLVEEQVNFIAPVVVMAGEYEMEALALGGLRILRGEESADEI